MKIADRMSSIPFSGIRKVFEEVTRREKLGEKIIHLEIGRPDFDTPRHIKEAGKRAIDEGKVHYTSNYGIPELREAIAGKLKEDNGLSYDPATEIIVTVGANEAVLMVMMALLNPGDEVLIPDPCWLHYLYCAQLAGAVPISVPLREENGFNPDINDFRSRVTSRTRMVIVNTPNNPSGMMYSAEFVEQIIRHCEQKGIYVIMDDIYHKLVFDGKKTPSCYKYTDKDIESSHIIAINGVSKLYGMTGFRVGWAIAGRSLVEIMTNVQGQITTCVSILLQAAAEGAMTGLQSSVESLRLQLENNRNVMLQELSSFTGVKTVKPDGTYYCLPDFRAYSNSSVELSSMLLKKALVVTVPGKEFGMEGYLRLSYAGTIKEITEGISRMKWALDPNAPNEIYVGDKKLVRDWL